jgi:hypothetical protein
MMLLLLLLLLIVPVVVVVGFGVVIAGVLIGTKLNAGPTAMKGGTFANGDLGI